MLIPENRILRLRLRYSFSSFQIKYRLDGWDKDTPSKQVTITSLIMMKLLKRLVI